MESGSSAEEVLQKYDAELIWVPTKGEEVFLVVT